MCEIECEACGTKVSIEAVRCFFCGSTVTKEMKSVCLDNGQDQSDVKKTHVKSSHSSHKKTINNKKREVNEKTVKIKLTREQKAFLSELGVSLEEVFDATGIKTSQYKSIMKKRNKLVACGVTPCKAAGHTLRTRAG